MTNEERQRQKNEAKKRWIADESPSEKRARLDKQAESMRVSRAREKAASTTK